MRLRNAHRASACSVAQHDLRARVSARTLTSCDNHAGFSTRAIHAGQEPDSAVGSVVPPIYATSTYIRTR